MRKLPLAVAVVLVLAFAAQAPADIAPQFSTVDPPPMFYTPGQAFSFQVIVPAVNGLSSYGVGIIFDTTPYSNPNLTVSVSPTSNYVFGPTSSNQNPSTFSAGPNAVEFTFSDSIAPSFVNTTTGVNDVLGQITVTPGSDLTVPINIYFDQGTDPQGNPITYANYFYETPPVIDPTVYTVNPLQAPPAVTPTPTAWLTLAIGAAILASRGRLKQLVPA
jgi:hypothetical protein